MSGEMLALPLVYQYRVESVSYTHLDVYKRQAFIQLLASAIDAKSPYTGCLLYTSRCV